MSPEHPDSATRLSMYALPYTAFLQFPQSLVLYYCTCRAIPSSYHALLTDRVGWLLSLKIAIKELFWP